MPEAMPCLKALFMDDLLCWSPCCGPECLAHIVFSIKQMCQLYTEQSQFFDWPKAMSNQGVLHSHEDVFKVFGICAVSLLRRQQSVYNNHIIPGRFQSNNPLEWDEVCGQWKISPGMQVCFSNSRCCGNRAFWLLFKTELFDNVCLLKHDAHWCKTTCSRVTES